MSYTLFYSLQAIRIISPPIVFKYIHPFYAMIIDEGVLDGIIAPHHVFKNLVPKEFHKNRKKYWDIPFDTWGFINSLQPILIKNHKYYDVFNNYRDLIIFLFIWRMIGIALIYKFNTLNHLILFPNFFIAVYLAVSFCSLKNITDKNIIHNIIFLFMILFYIRELFIIKLNS